MRDARTRPNPGNLPPGLRNYFDNALKRDVIAETYFRWDVINLADTEESQAKIMPELAVFRVGNSEA